MPERMAARGGEIQFMEDSTGGTSRIVLNGTLDISLHHLPGVSVGSIEGNGLVSLGLNNLTVGSNNGLPSTMARDVAMITPKALSLTA